MAKNKPSARPESGLISKMEKYDSFKTFPEVIKEAFKEKGKKWNGVIALSYQSMHNAPFCYYTIQFDDNGGSALTKEAEGSEKLKDALLADAGGTISLACIDEEGDAFVMQLCVIYDLISWNMMCNLDDKGFGATVYRKVSTRKRWAWKKMGNMVDYCGRVLWVINSPEDILKKKNPYTFAFAKEWVKSNGGELWRVCLKLLEKPQLEQLSKAGYAFADTLLRCGGSDFLSDVKYKWNPLIKKNETAAAKMFKCSKDLCGSLKEERDISTWDIYRRLERTGKLLPGDIGELYSRGYSDKVLRKINSILCKKFDEKTYFSMRTLLNYLTKLESSDPERGEGLEAEDAVFYIEDSLRMYRDMEMKPRLLTCNGLKTEHDKLTREFNATAYRRQTAVTDLLEKRCEEYKKYDYTEKLYFARAIRSYEDLADEGRQQSNCVLCYAGSVAKGHTLIFVVRKVKKPDESLVTLELTPGSFKVRQARMQYNRAVTNKSLQAFINRLTEHLRNLKKEEKKAKKKAS